MGSPREAKITDAEKFQLPRNRQALRSGKERRCNACILVLRLLCLARADNIGNYPEMRLDTRHTGRVMVYRRNSEDYSGLDARYVRRRIRRFPLLAMYAYG